jgi:hypothetical protein
MGRRSIRPTMELLGNVACDLTRSTTEVIHHVA